jgi:hypothetical protein
MSDHVDYSNFQKQYEESYLNLLRDPEQTRREGEEAERLLADVKSDMMNRLESKKNQTVVVSTVTTTTTTTTTTADVDEDVLSILNDLPWKQIFDACTQEKLHNTLSRHEALIAAMDADETKKTLSVVGEGREIRAKVYEMVNRNSCGIDWTNDNMQIVHDFDEFLSAVEAAFKRHDAELKKAQAAPVVGSKRKLDDPVPTKREDIKRHLQIRAMARQLVERSPEILDKAKEIVGPREMVYAKCKRMEEEKVKQMGLDLAKRIVSKVVGENVN